MRLELSVFSGRALCVLSTCEGASGCVSSKPRSFALTARSDGASVWVEPLSVKLVLPTSFATACVRKGCSMVPSVAAGGSAGISMGSAASVGRPDRIGFSNRLVISGSSESGLALTLPRSFCPPAGTVRGAFVTAVIEAKSGSVLVLPATCTARGSLISVDKTGVLISLNRSSASQGRVPSLSAGRTSCGPRSDSMLRPSGVGRGADGDSTPCSTCHGSIDRGAIVFRLSGSITARWGLSSASGAASKSAASSEASGMSPAPPGPSSACSSASPAC